MKGSTLLASSATLEGVRAAVSRFYCGSTVALTPYPGDPDVWTVATGRGLMPTVIVRKAGSRYRFEQLPPEWSIREGGAA